MSVSRVRSSVSSTVISFVRLAIGTRSPGVVREQHLAGASVLDEIRARVDARSSREGGGDEGECGRADEQAQLHGREG